MGCGGATRWWGSAAMAAALACAVSCGGALVGGNPGGSPDAGSDGGGSRDGGDGGDGGNDGGDAGPSDGGGSGDGGPLASCDAACFWWKAPAPTQPPSPPVTDIYVDKCNAYGLDAGVCPPAFRCGAEVVLRSAALSMHIPPCEPTGSPPLRLDADLPAQPVPAAPVDVTLAFRLDGGAWPTTSLLHGAGQLSITRSDGGPPLTVDAPTSWPGELRLRLDRGTYDVSANLNNAIDNAAYPARYGQGTLVVADAGTAFVPFEGIRVPFEVQLDGRAIGPLAAGESVRMSFAGGHNQSAYLSFEAGQSPSGVVVLEPDVYKVTIATNSGGTAPAVLNGQVVFAAFDPRSVAGTARFNLETVSVSGTVRADGADLPAATSGGSVSFFDESGSRVYAWISSARPARYSARLYKGRYDVGYQNLVISSLPSGGTIALRGWTAAAGTLDLSLGTVSVSGTVTLNGAAPPDQGDWRGPIEFASRAGSASFFLGKTGAATFSGKLFAGAYDVSVTRLTPRWPYLTWPLAVGWTASSAPQQYAIAAHTLAVTLTANGAQPSDAPAGASSSARGSLTVTRLDRPLGVPNAPSTSVSMPLTGPLTASVMVPDGDWTVSYGLGDSTWTGLPKGGQLLAEVHVGPDVARSFDLKYLDVSGTLTRGHLPLALPATGKTRGEIYLSGWYGSVRVPLANSGAATWSARLYPGLYDVLFYCDPKACDTALMPSFQWLFYGMSLR